MLAIAVALSLAAPAGNLPAYTDYVVDQASVIDAASLEHLKAVCSRLDHAGVAQIAVATIPDLGDASIEDYAADLFKKWGIGHDKKRKDGLLVLFVPGGPGHRKIRIEVGYGLEGILPDGKVGEIRTQQAFPYMKQNDYGQAAVHVVDALAGVIEADAAAGGDTAPTAASPRGGRGVGAAAPADAGSSGLVVTLLAMLALLIALASSGARKAFPGTKTTLAGAVLTAVSVLALIMSGGGAGWLALVLGLILNAVIWTSIRSHRCPRDGSWMTIDEEVIDYPTYFSQGLAHVTQRCTNRSCGFHHEYDKTLPRKQMSTVGSGGGGGWSGGGGGGGDGFSGGGGGDSGGGGASGEV
jgi:uncharacterized membrane protein YgcG